MADDDVIHVQQAEIEEVGRAEISPVPQQPTGHGRVPARQAPGPDDHGNGQVGHRPGDLPGHQAGQGVPAYYDAYGDWRCRSVPAKSQ